MAHPSFAQTKVDDASPTLTFGPLTRTDFVRYAGASHDFNPIHHDEIYATERGNKTVFGVGMLSAGYGGRLMTDWFGIPALRRLRIRFASRVWPGDLLTASGKVTAKNDADGLLECEFTLVNQAGEVVVRGDATVAPGI